MTDTTTQKPSAPQGRGIGKLSSNAKHIVADLGKNGIFLALIAVIVLFSITTDGILLRPQNISNLIVQNGYILILAIGMVLVIVAGHIDLSVGSVERRIGASSAGCSNWNSARSTSAVFAASKPRRALSEIRLMASPRC